ncbi:IclR family transcriptional regulator C-terminal domain-containing protein [Halomonas alkaliantarctica]|uniref:IclR family transcriptional regulator C-terminal domain-containing protein n=1 Tax=Halomonas alkaliantarctica TaxID=232346 RepID=A0ABY8LLA2_9GAMM|nr:IclR family transcriptional regulator C-terminal domain-containing protein [Halomonas alkaliantarctica]WGI25215.1 IclR family transcriptional regulator C-terminal domain-containing protein [Halomonas alkaliantarctica]
MSGRGAERILELVEWLARQERARSLVDVVDALSLPKSSALMLLRTLVEKGYVSRGSSGLYQLQRLPGEAGADKYAWGTIVRKITPLIQQGVDLTGESGFIGVFDSEMRVKYLNKILPAREIRYDRDITVSRDAFQVTSGQVLLAQLSGADLNKYFSDTGLCGLSKRQEVENKLKEVKECGYAVNLKGTVEGAAGVAAPIFDKHGNCLAAVNIAGPHDRIKEKKELIIKVVTDLAQKASSSLVLKRSDV